MHEIDVEVVRKTKESVGAKFIRSCVSERRLSSSMLGTEK